MMAVPKKKKSLLKRKLNKNYSLNPLCEYKKCSICKKIKISTKLNVKLLRIIHITNLINFKKIKLLQLNSCSC